MLMCDMSTSTNLFIVIIIIQSVPLCVSLTTTLKHLQGSESLEI